MSKDLNSKKYLLLVSGGHCSHYLAECLKEDGIEFDCLHFLDSTSHNTAARRSAEATASKFGSRLHTFDVTHLVHALKPENRKALFDFGNLTLASPDTLPLMLSLAGIFAEQHGYKVVCVGFVANALPRGFLEHWNNALFQWMDEEDWHDGVEPILRVEAPLRDEMDWLEPTGTQKLPELSKTSGLTSEALAGAKS